MMCVLGVVDTEVLKLGKVFWRWPAEALPQVGTDACVNAGSAGVCWALYECVLTLLAWP